ncbi:hypothetical protein LCGC14_2915230, partial [marine sediment metagenome]
DRYEGGPGGVGAGGGLMAYNPSRKVAVAREAARKLGAEVVVVGPPTLVPGAIASMGCSIAHSLDEVLGEVDVINMLRIQFERFGGGLFPSLREYHKLYGMDAERLRRCRPDVLIMHPGPINRGVEITSEVADGPNSCILQQVTNGLAIRMAVLYLVSQGRKNEFLGRIN